MFGKANNKEFQCLEYPNFLFPMFGKAKVKVSKSQNPDFQCLKKPKIKNCNVWNS